MITLTTLTGTAAQRRRLVQILTAIMMTVSLLLMITGTALADSVTISDGAGVLDKARIQSEGAKLPYPLAIYTTNSFTGSQAEFEARTQSHVTSSRLIVIAIDTVHHWFYIKAGSQVPLANSAAEDAYNAFKNNYNNGDYTGATLAAIRSLEGALSSAGEGGGASSGLLSNGLGALLCIGLLVLLIAGVIFGVMRNRMRSGWGRPAMPYQEPYQPGYPPGYPSGYPPGYYPPAQGSGMNPWAAGGLGALGGGLIGYELGKMAGEQEAHHHEGGFLDPGAGGGDFGGGAGGDFGGGGGGDFGGGAGGDFGGGGDSGAGGSF